jgi:hypothetical protein
MGKRMRNRYSAPYTSTHEGCRGIAKSSGTSGLWGDRPPRPASPMKMYRGARKIKAIKEIRVGTRTE